MKPADTQRAVPEREMAFKFEWQGTSLSDLEWALDIARKQIMEGYERGVDSNEDGHYNYHLGEPGDAQLLSGAPPMIIHLEGGLVQGITNKPDGLSVEVHDYDLSDYLTDEELEEHQMDADGRRYHLGEW